MLPGNLKMLAVKTLNYLEMNTKGILINYVCIMNVRKNLSCCTHPKMFPYPQCPAVVQAALTCWR